MRRLNPSGPAAALTLGLGVFVVGALGSTFNWTRHEVWRLSMVAGAVASIIALWRHVDFRFQWLDRRSTEVELALTRTSEDTTTALMNQRELWVEEFRMTMSHFSRGILEEVAEVSTDVSRAFTGTSESITQSLDAAAQEQSALFDRAIAKHVHQLGGDLGGIMGVYQALRPDLPLPSFDGWAVSGSCAHRLIAALTSERPASVVELGSGLSTVLMALAVERFGISSAIWSIEHDPSWARETERRLEDHGVRDRVQVILAPLIDLEINEEAWIWYDLDYEVLPETIDFLFIDGPPLSTGRRARYPAIPLLAPILSKAARIILDDSLRPDEESIVKRWLADYTDMRQVGRTHRHRYAEFVWEK